MNQRLLILPALFFLLTSVGPIVFAQGEPEGRNFHYTVEIDGLTIATFDEVSGIAIEVDVIEHQVVNPDGSQTTIKTPGRTRWGNIVLKRGLTTSDDLWDWQQEVVDQNPAARKNGSIIVFDQLGAEVARYNFTNGWPSKWSLNADSSIAVESITIAVEKVERG